MIMGIYDEEFEGPLTPLVSSDEEDQDSEEVKNSARTQASALPPQNLEEGEIFEPKVTVRFISIGILLRK